VLAASALVFAPAANAAPVVDGHAVETGPRSTARPTTISLG
jgi:hypothetical protein